MGAQRKNCVGMKNCVGVVPEPSTWAMMLPGLVGQGFAFLQSRGAGCRSPYNANSLAELGRAGLVP